MCFLSFITKQFRVLSHEAIWTQEGKKSSIPLMKDILFPILIIESVMSEHYCAYKKKKKLQIMKINIWKIILYNTST